MSTIDSRPAAGLHPTMVMRMLVLLYGIGAYVFFVGTFLYLIGFVGNWVVPKAIDTGAPPESVTMAIVVDVLLLAAFAIQHTIMARPAFKEWWTRYVPSYVERSTFVLLATAILALLAWKWQPLPAVVWRVESRALVSLLDVVALAGWGIALLATFLIDHLELFGLRQTISFALGHPDSHPEFKERLLYRWVRHPLMLGFLVAFWAAPVMTQGHLLFAAVATAYILLALQIEERTLVYLHGERYRDYQRRVPMLIPFAKRGRR